MIVDTSGILVHNACADADPVGDLIRMGQGRNSSPSFNSPDASVPTKTPAKAAVGEPRKKTKAKERRAKEQAEARKKKHGDEDWEEPASEGYAKWKARELEKSKGKDARRKSHDKKRKGEGDRSKKRLDEDYE